MTAKTLDCKFCGEPISLMDTEVATHKDGSMSHTGCFYGASLTARMRQTFQTQISALQAEAVTLDKL